MDGWTDGWMEWDCFGMMGISYELGWSLGAFRSHREDRKRERENEREREIVKREKCPFGQVDVPAGPGAARQRQNTLLVTR